jgi:transposase
VCELSLELVDVHATGRRAFAVEGTGSFGAGLTRFLTDDRERVLEVGRLRRERRCGGKTDALDAVRAAQSVLAQRRPSTPLRSELRPPTRARLSQRLAATRPHGRQDAELRGSTLALRSIAREALPKASRSASSLIATRQRRDEP